MYTNTLQIKDTTGLLEKVYAKLCDCYNLPALKTMLESLYDDVYWPSDAEYTVYNLQPLSKPEKRIELIIAFAPTSDQEVQIKLTFSEPPLSLNDKLEEMMITFPTRLSRGTFSRMLGIIKYVWNRAAIILEVHGQSEVGVCRIIREDALAAFIWVEELQRYLHVSENSNNARHLVYSKEIEV